MPNGLKTALLLGLLSGLLLVIGQFFGGANGMLIAFIFAVVMNFGSYWFSDKIVLRMYHAQEVGPGHRLHTMVERLSRQAQLPMPKVYIIPDPSPNAFATGRNPSHAAVAATEGILQILSDSELEGVIAHELAHVQPSRHPHQLSGGDRSRPPSCWRRARRSLRRCSAATADAATAAIAATTRLRCWR